MFILKVDSGGANVGGGIFVGSRVLRADFPGNAGGKGVRWLAEYFMGYYTIWLAFVKRIFVPFWELGVTPLVTSIELSDMLIALEKGRRVDAHQIVACEEFSRSRKH